MYNCIRTYYVLTKNLGIELSGVSFPHPHPPRDNQLVSQSIDDQLSIVYMMTIALMMIMVVNSDGKFGSIDDLALHLLLVMMVVIKSDFPDRNGDHRSCNQYFF